jgi:hypothetical protein
MEWFALLTGDGYDSRASIMASAVAMKSGLEILFAIDMASSPSG